MKLKNQRPGPKGAVEPVKKNNNNNSEINADVNIFTS
jgi:hypothetical protein